MSQGVKLLLTYAHVTMCSYWTAYCATKGFKHASDSSIWTKKDIEILYRNIGS